MRSQTKPQRFERIKTHFEDVAKRFDARFFKVMPFYKDAIAALVVSLPFNPDKKIKVLDLGCGTGNISKAVLERFPRAELTCVDMAQNMIAAAKQKLKSWPKVQYWTGDMCKFDFASYDAVVSSMALHHVAEKQKPAFYKKLVAALRPGGVFYNIDIVMGSSRHLHEMYLEAWKTFMRRSLSAPEIKDLLLRHSDEDRPARLTRELEFLSKAGLKELDVVWKYYSFAVYGGRR